MSDAKPRIMSLNEMNRIIGQSIKDQERLLKLAQQLQDDVIWIQKQVDAIQASVTGLNRRPRS